MALIDDLLKSETGRAVAIGLGAAVLAPVVIAAVTGMARPVARAALKSGIIVYEKGRETLAEFGEVVDDLVAEARAELEQQHQTTTVAAAAATAHEHPVAENTTGETADKV